MRPPDRPPMPPLEQTLRELNELLADHALPSCTRLQPVDDPDTANPNLIGQAAGRRYAIKVCFRHPDALERQLCVANAVAESTGLPIPRHLCCATEPGRLPLMVMEWMNGEQLRLVLPTAGPGVAAELVRDWGRCIARFHHARVEPQECGDWPDIEEAHAGFRGWLRGAVRQRLGALEADGRWSAAEAGAVRRYLAEREASLEAPGVPGLVKADQGLRDALALVEPRPHISALLDWERVTMGDTLWELASIFVRMDLDGLWPDFRTGYAAEAGPPLPPGPHSEFYLMTWALIQVTWSDLPATRYDRAQSILRALLAGSPLPSGV